jgi:Flp pilus assembly protein TadD
MKSASGFPHAAQSGMTNRKPASRNWNWLFGLLLTAAVLAAYLPALRGGFIWDDDLHVTNNPTLRDWTGLKDIWFEVGKTLQYYPLVHSSFWLEYHLWGLNPIGYHLVNVLLHALAAMLLYRLLTRLRLPGAWLAAAIFALHPVCVESVAWISERKNVLSTVFYLAAALAYLRYTQRSEVRPPSSALRPPPSGAYWLALLLFVAALLSKTVACSLPAALLLVVWWKRGSLTWRDVGPLLPFFVAGVALGLNTVSLEKHQVGALGAEWSLTFWERCLVAGRALWFYAEKLVWPANLTFSYPRWEISPAVWWQWCFPVAALGVVAALWFLRHRLGRGPLVAVLCFAGTLFPALGFFDVYPFRYSFVADHFQYLASLGLLALAGAGIHSACGWLARGKRFVPPAVCGVLLPTLGVLTWRQCGMYADMETLWRTTIARNPRCSMAYNNLGHWFFEGKRLAEAVRYFRQAVELQPDNGEAHNNLGTALLQQGQVDEAIGHFARALAIIPNDGAIHGNLGNALAQQGRMVEALRHYEKALSLEPANPLCANNLAWLLATGPVAGVRDGARAVELGERAVALSGGKNPLLIGTLAAAYAEAGRFAEAVVTGEKARALAHAAGNRDLVEKNEKLLELYRLGRSYHETTGSTR